VLSVKLSGSQSSRAPSEDFLQTFFKVKSYIERYRVIFHGAKDGFQISSIFQCCFKLGIAASCLFLICRSTSVRRQCFIVNASHFHAAEHRTLGCRLSWWKPSLHDLQSRFMYIEAQRATCIQCILWHYAFKWNKHTESEGFCINALVFFLDDIDHHWRHGILGFLLKYLNEQYTAKKEVLWKSV
jgi:hypothetical protein